MSTWGRGSDAALTAGWGRDSGGDDVAEEGPGSAVNPLRLLCGVAVAGVSLPRFTTPVTVAFVSVVLEVGVALWRPLSCAVVATCRCATGRLLEGVRASGCACMLTLAAVLVGVHDSGCSALPPTTSPSPSPASSSSSDPPPPPGLGEAGA